MGALATLGMQCDTFGPLLTRTMAQARASDPANCRAESGIACYLPRPSGATSSRISVRWFASCPRRILGSPDPASPCPLYRSSSARAASQRACEVSSSRVLSVFRPSSYIYFNPTSVSFRFSSHLSNYSALRFQPPKVIVVGGALQFRRLSVVPTSTSIFFSHFI
jgi:hypothetical protein